MKALFSKLKPKDPGNEDETAKRSTSSLSSRRLATEFNGLSRTTSVRVPQQRQNSVSYRSSVQQSASGVESHTTRTLSRISFHTRGASSTDRSPSSSITESRSRRQTPNDKSKQQNSGGEDSPVQIPRCRGPGAKRSSLAEYPKPLPKPPTSDVDDAFGGAHQSGKTSRSLNYWRLKKTGKLGSTEKTPCVQQSTSTSFFQHGSSGYLMYKAGAESRPPSVAMSPSTSSQITLSSEENKEYCKSRQSWTGMTEVDLVANLSLQERTRQEVLFEIVSSEERCVDLIITTRMNESDTLVRRYVLDLIKMKETFIDKLIQVETEEAPEVLAEALLPTQSRHSDSSTSVGSPSTENPMPCANRSLSATSTYDEDASRLPIAARFSTGRSTPSVRDLSFGNDQDPVLESVRIFSDTRGSPPHRRADLQEDGIDPDATVRIKRAYHFLSRRRSEEERDDVNRMIPCHNPGSSPSRHLSDQALSTVTHPYGCLAHRRPILDPSYRSPHLHRQNSTSPPAAASRLAFSIRKRISSASFSSDLGGNRAALPEDFRIVLQVIGEKLLKGHVALSDALRKRYNEQYPLVRGLADVFIEHVSSFQSQP